MSNYDALNADLKSGVVRVNFTKANGDEREMICTKNPDLFTPPESKGSNRTPNPDVIVVWDLDNDGWRSFRVDSVLDWCIDEFV
jgi:hypothetical protein